MEEEKGNLANSNAQGIYVSYVGLVIVSAVLILSVFGFYRSSELTQRCENYKCNFATISEGEACLVTFSDG
jgi:hypothetical protein